MECDRYTKFGTTSTLSQLSTRSVICKDGSKPERIRQGLWARVVNFPEI